ncbi:hypothetical protein C8F01DRAFT_1249181 [Mycena amicta]|nr:hypothetical protein C8F01DRAFT_1249181 [Mycena amicta]
MVTPRAPVGNSASPETVTCVTLFAAEPHAVRRLSNGQWIFIHVSFDPPLEAACDALSLCTNVTRVAGAGPLVSRLLLPVIRPMRLQRIGLFLTHIFIDTAYDVDLALPCFQ